MRQIVVLLGQTGSGKSYRLREIIRAAPRVVIYDTLAHPDYDEFHRISSFPELCRFLASNPPVFRVAYTWDGESVDQEEDFDRVCRAVYLCRNLVFAVEEVSEFCSPSFLPRPLRRIVALGRHPGISFYCTSQVPSQVHSLIRSQASRIISFTQIEPVHLAWCRAVMGEWANALPELPRHHAVDWTPLKSCYRDASWTPVDLDGAQDELPLDTGPTVQ